MSKDVEKKLDSAAANGEQQQQQYSLNDDRRVKVLSPGAMVAKRFFRNRIAVVGLVILAFMFLFSFVGGLLTPYKEDQQFYTTEMQNKEFAGAAENKEFRYTTADGQNFGSVLQAKFVLAANTGAESFTYSGVNYNVIKEGEDFYRITLEDGTDIGIAGKDLVKPTTEGAKLSFEFTCNALKAFTNAQTSFEADGNTYTIEDGIVSLNGEETAFVSRYVVQPISSDVFLSREFQEELIAELNAGATKFNFTDADGDPMPANREDPRNLNGLRIVNRRESLAGLVFPDTENRG